MHVNGTRTSNGMDTNTRGAHIHNIHIRLKDVLRGKDNSWWKENLHMSYNNFAVIWNELHDYIAREATHLRLPISVDQRVAFTMKLATKLMLIIEHCLNCL